MAKEPNYENSIISIKFAQAEQPKFVEKKGGYRYVEFGQNNNYPEYLLSLFNESPKHGAIIKSKAKYVFGKGFKNIPPDRLANSSGETWNSVGKKAILDDEIYAGYYLQIIYNRAGKIKDVFHIEFYKVRTNKAGNKFYVKNDWSDSRETVRTYPGFDGVYDPENPTKILFYKQYNPKGDVYPIPNYMQALNYIESDVQIGRHILGNAKDGFVSSLLVNMNHGEPKTEEAKADLEKRMKKKFAGSEGDRVMISFNKSKDNGVTIDALPPSMLTKEDFTPVNQLIQQEIYAGHEVTSPILFGIKTEGQLGGRTEIQEAYEIFNNTYVNERQQAHEELFSRLFKLADVPVPAEIIPVEPLGFTLKDELLLKVMPREYFLDKMGVDQKYYQIPAAEGTAAAPAQGAPGEMANDNIKNLTGRQHQQVMRIVRQFLSGKMTKPQAALMLKSGFQFTDEDVNTFLGLDNEKFASQDEIDFALLDQFAQVGESKDLFDILDSKLARESEYFADVAELNQLESNILNLIRKDKRITAEVIAKTLDISKSVVAKAMSNMQASGVLSEVQVSVGEDTVIERTATDIDVLKPPATTTDILLRYSYEGPKDDRNRPFCAKMMELNRVYSRADIELISERLGYSVWDRRGGWFTQPDGTHRPYCRHQWFAFTVTRKKS